MRRSEIEICADIVGTADGGARKTQLVYQANLNFCVIERYLDPLVKHWLVQVRSPFFYATEKGRCFRIMVDQVRACLGLDIG